MNMTTLAVIGPGFMPIQIRGDVQGRTLNLPGDISISHDHPYHIKPYQMYHNHIILYSHIRMSYIDIEAMAQSNS